MEITFKYHGRFTDLFEKKKEILSVKSRTAEALRKELEGVDVRFRESVYQLAQNNKIITGNDPITAAEVDVFPPFSGG
ncbi:hypothetical protein [uncultured Dokdonia sp.]|uniref:MoaD/ThiS family protein n=1 Tax=uncultured Dokdonia sp. TaxID=575653 RepID=UPI00261FDC42|nr:hypothetical protein [uncultured Dokdonia sp.]